jgi:dephospho-CoA kinase
VTGGDADRSGPLVVGLAGGIGSGKSLVGRMLRDLGCAVVDSDVEAREAIQRPEARRTLVAWWGEGILDDAGDVDRSKVASIVFNDARERERLEGLIHPMVRRSRAEVAERAHEEGAPCVVVDAPLLFEVGLDEECDTTIFVDADRAERVRRVRERGWDEAELDRRERAQLPPGEKRARADHVIDNNGTVEALRGRVREVFEAITRENGA